MATSGTGILALLIKDVSKTSLPPSLGLYGPMWAIGIAGPLYDLYFVETINGPKTVCFMKLYFFFRDTTIDTWTTAEQKSLFATRWIAEIQKKFNQSALTKTESGRIVGLEFHFGSALYSWEPGDHWTIEVGKLPKGEFRDSHVARQESRTRLYSNDLDFITRRDEGQSYKQRPAIHEFAHMIGAWDEYLDTGCDANGNRSDGHKCNAIPRDPRYIRDYSSVANNGEIIKPRHLEAIKQWTEMAARLSPVEKDLLHKQPLDEHLKKLKNMPAGAGGGATV